MSILCPLLLLAEVAPKKKILILCTGGGNGNQTAANALVSLLEDQYEFKIVYPIEELNWPFKSGEGFYNFLLQNGWTNVIGLIAHHIIPNVFRGKEAETESVVARHIERERPDLIISIVQYVNFPASEAARKKGVPYLLLTTDHDLEIYAQDLEKVVHPSFTVTIGGDLKASRGMLREKNISPSQIRITGFPVRPDFFETKDKDLIRAQYGISPLKPVLMIMIGGQGGRKTRVYARAISKLDLGMQIIVCAGKNPTLAQKLRRLRVHPSNTLHVIEYTDRISDLMAISNVIITKSGTLTVSEALAMRLPILIDMTTSVASWEKPSIELVLRHQLGETIPNFRGLEKLMRKYLFDSDIAKRTQLAYDQLPVNRFHEQIGPLIEEILKPSLRVADSIQ